MAALRCVCDGYVQRSRGSRQEVAAGTPWRTRTSSCTTSLDSAWNSAAKPPSNAMAVIEARQCCLCSRSRCSFTPLVDPRHWSVRASAWPGHRARRGPELAIEDTVCATERARVRPAPRVRVWCWAGGQTQEQVATGRTEAHKTCSNRSVRSVWTQAMASQALRAAEWVNASCRGAPRLILLGSERPGRWR